MQFASSGWHSSSNTAPPRAEPKAAVPDRPLDGTVALARGAVVIAERIESWPGEPVVEAPPERVVCAPIGANALPARVACAPIDAGAPLERVACVPIGADAPTVDGDVDPPIDGVVCARIVGEVGAAIVRTAAVATLDCAEVPIVAIDDGELVGAPTVGMIDVPIVVGAPIVLEAPSVGVVDVPIVGVDVAPSVCESVVVADPVREVSAGSAAAAVAPTPNLAANELKSVVAPRPNVASKASKSGSAPIGVVGA